jgi:hypothetical protein
MTLEEDIVHDIRKTVVALEIRPELVEQKGVPSVLYRIV